MRRLLSLFFASLPLAVVLGWLVGRILSDRFPWSQWLSWMPTPAVVGGTLFSLALSWFFSTWSAWSRRLAKFKPSSLLLRAGRLRRVAALATIPLILFTLIIEWRLPIGLFPSSPPPKARPFSVLYWNHAGNWRNDWMQTTSTHLADVSILAAPRYPQYMDQLMEKLAADHPGTRHYQRLAFYSIISKWPILRWSSAPLNLPTLQTKLDPYASTLERGWYWNRGEACWIELDSAADLGRNLIIWIMDMPSDPRLHRAQLTAVAAQTLRDATPAIFSRGPVGQFIPAPATTPGFPTPDLIVGDLNIPRGAFSLTALVGQARPVYETAGVGPEGSYHRLLPVLGIDQMFMNAPIDATRYDLFDPGFGTHLAQRAEFFIP
jgi:hypothetical protein